MIYTAKGFGIIHKADVFLEFSCFFSKIVELQLQHQSFQFRADFLRIDWFYFLAVQGTLKSFLAPQFEGINSLVFNLLYGPTLTSVHDFWKNHSIDYTDLCQNSDVLWISSINLEKHKVSVEKDYLWTDFLFIGREPKGNQRVHKGNRHEIKYEWHIYIVQK